MIIQDYDTTKGASSRDEKDYLLNDQMKRLQNWRTFDNPDDTTYVLFQYGTYDIYAYLSIFLSKVGMQAKTQILLRRYSVFISFTYLSMTYAPSCNSSRPAATAADRI